MRLDKSEVDVVLMSLLFWLGLLTVGAVLFESVRTHFSLHFVAFLGAGATAALEIRRRRRSETVIQGA